MLYRFCVVILLTSSVNFIKGSEIKSDQPTNSSCENTGKNNLAKLKKELLCGYDSNVRPVLHHSNKTSIKITAFPLNLGWIMERHNKIWMSFWFFIEWHDEFLMWNKTDYEGLNEFHPAGGTIWVPEILVNDPPQSDLSRGIMRCRVRFNGRVECSMTPGVTAQCAIDLTYFPYDRHSCRVVFGTRYYSNNALSLSLANNNKDLNLFQYYQPHGSWNMVSLRTRDNITNMFGGITMANIEYTFVIERRSSTYNVIYTSPALVLMIMVLSVFWLEVQCSARIILPGLSVIGHLIIIQWLMRVIETNFEHLPVIIVLFRDSLLMTGFALAWTIAARAMYTASSTPYWLYIVSTNLNNSHTAKYLLPQDIFMKSGMSEDENETSLVVQRDCVEQQWRILVTLSDRLLFGIYILSYMYFFMRLTP